MLVFFHTSGDAIAGERKLLDSGVDAQLVSAPKTVNFGGVCLRVNAAEIDTLRLLLGETIRDICPEDDGAELF